jgi:uncharacterized membrane protein
MTFNPSSDGHADLQRLTRMELVISYTLLVGVLLSATVILTGILLFALTQNTGYARILPHHLADLITYQRHTGPGYFPSSVHDVVGGAMAGKAYAIVGLGLLLLIATPVIRVVLSVFFFLEQRDWLYVWITLIVLSVLLLGLFGGA